MADLTGKTLGKYQLIERLGRGGMAEVYKAYQPSLERYVAVKVLHGHLVDEAGFIGRFQREAKSVAGLHHPNIVQVFDFDVDLGEDVHYMVMEYLDGVTLKARLDDYFKQGRRMPIGEIVRTFKGVLDGIGYAHAQGMVHRDLKPANIMFDSKDRPVVTDFGVAKIVGATRYTASGAIMGTPAYMSPEQGQGAPGDERSDLYALGVMLYECLTGRVPYDADTPVAILLKHITDPLPIIREVLPDLPDPLEGVLLKALAKNPNDRYQSAADFKAALERYERGVAESPTAPGPAPAAAPQAPGVSPIAPAAATPAGRAEGRADRLRRSPALMRRLIAAGAIGVLAVVGALALARLAGPSPAQQAIAEGQALLAQGNYEQAQAAFNRALSADPDSVAGLLGRAEAAVNLGMPDVALDDAEQAVRLAPDDPAAILALAEYTLEYTADADPNQLIAGEINHAIALAPDNPRGYYVRGLAYFRFLSEAQLAAQDFQTAVRLNPQEPEYQHQLADARFAIKDYSGALEAIERAIALRPDDPHYRVERALAHFALQNYAAAIEDLAALIAQDPAQPSYYAMRAYVRYQRSEYSDALADTDQALQRDPQNAAALYVRGLAFFQLEDYAAALNSYDAVLGHLPGEYDWPFLNRDQYNEINADRGELFEAMGRPADALQAFSASIEIEPDWFYPYYRRGLVYLAEGQADRARQDLNQALSLAPDADWRGLIQKALNQLPSQDGL